MTGACVPFCLAFLLLPTCGLLGADTTCMKSPSEARQILAGSGDAVQRRAAYRLLAADEQTRRKILDAALADRDPLIRRHALLESLESLQNDGTALVRRMSNDPDPDVMSLLLAFAEARTPRDRSLELLKIIGGKTVLPDIRRKVQRQTSFAFFRSKRRLSENPAHDHEIIKVRTIMLNEKGWKFRPDPSGNLHGKNVFDPAYDDSAWKNINIGYWEKQGYPGYDGIAWYRMRFTMPARPDCNAVELHFAGVDESAWVWLNGKYIGQRDIGVDGWKIPFYLDVTDEIRFGGENVLTVRVEDTCFGGGIWKPVSIDILK